MIIFVKPRTTSLPDGGIAYQSYSGEFWPLVELAGFQMCYPDEMHKGSVLGCDRPWEDSRFTFIVSPVNGEYGPDHFSCPSRKAKVVHWNLERDPTARPDPRFDETWVSDRWYAEQIGARYVPLGTDSRLIEVDCDPKRDTEECYHVRGWPSDGRDIQWEDVGTTFKYDFCHFSYMSGRRQAIIPRLESMGFSIAPNAWGEERHRILLQSKAMLSIHQDEHPIIEPLRYALAAAYGLHLLADESRDPHPWTVDPMRETYDNLLGAVLQWLKPPPLEEYNFKKIVEDACLTR